MMNDVEKELKEKELVELIDDLNQSAQDLYNNSPVELKDRQYMSVCIERIKTANVYNEEALEDVIGEAYGQMFLLSTKAMYQNVVALNKVSSDEISQKIKDTLKEMEMNLYNVIKGLEDRDEDLYNKNIDKIENIADRLEQIKVKILKK
ncbi:MAG: hypothetical protein H7263_17830 [Candidatus Sericytochromatia bacterium]|nr:hypothetical protein [Candidatus Sericytochromatia bacterium]